MMDNTNTSNQIISDKGILEKIGQYLKQQRLEQNKTQNQLAEAAGINRSTLIELEQGKRGNLLTLIQVLRALNQLHIFNQFEVQTQISPIKLAEIEQAKRQRASKQATNPSKQPKSNW
jgi:transcriptional regulator with XRE-family HTH domain